MYIRQTGAQTGGGADLFLLHGWRMNLSCWKPLTEELTDRSYRMTSVDLPGHGRSIGDRHSLARPETLVEQLLTIAPPDAIWIGWSLGGLLAQMAAARHANRIRALISISMGCRYSAAPDWEYGVDTRSLNAMNRQLAHAPTDCINQFIELQTINTEHEMQTLNRLKKLCARPCELEELHAGLKLLETADLRTTMKTRHGRVLFIAGEQDQICPHDAVEQSAELCRNGSYATIPGAGHAPLLSHPQTTAQVIDEFCNKSNE